MKETRNKFFSKGKMKTCGLVLIACVMASCNFDATTSLDTSSATSIDLSGVELRILNPETIYYDEISEGKVQVETSVDGEHEVIYMLDQTNSYASIDDNGLITISEQVTKNYMFVVTVVLKNLRSKYDSIDFTVLLTRGVIVGEKQISQVVVTVNGDPSSNRGISWFTSSDIEDSVAYVSTASNFAQATRYSGQRKAFDKNAEADSTTKTTFYNHQCVVSGLAADTTYYYKVGSDALDLFSSVGTFKTTKPHGAIKILLTSDIHVGSNETSTATNRFYHNIIKDATSKHGELDLLLNTGDMVTNWSGGYRYFESEWAKAMNISSYLRSNTFVPVSGNHDCKYGSAEHLSSFPNHYSLPESPSVINDGQTHGPNYSFDIADAHITIVNHVEEGQYSAQQDSWLANDLSNTDKQWKVVFSHIALPEDAKRTIEDHGVILAYSGHEHMYHRSHPLLNNVAQATTSEGNYFVNQVGTTYVVNSTTGGGDSWSTYQPALIDMEGFGLGSSLSGYGTVQSRWGVYTVLTIDDSTLQAQIYLRANTTATGLWSLYKTYGFINS